MGTKFGQTVLKTKINKKMPYDYLKSQEIYDVVNQAVNDLVGNQDIEETTQHDYIVGYIVKKILSAQKKQYKTATGKEQ